MIYPEYPTKRELIKNIIKRLKLEDDKRIYNSYGYCGLELCNKQCLIALWEKIMKVKN